MLRITRTRKHLLSFKTSTSSAQFSHIVHEEDTKREWALRLKPWHRSSANCWLLALAVFWGGGLKKKRRGKRPSSREWLVKVITVGGDGGGTNDGQSVIYIRAAWLCSESFFFRSEARRRVSVQSERHLSAETAAILEEHRGEGGRGERSAISGRCSFVRSSLAGSLAVARRKNVDSVPVFPSSSRTSGEETISFYFGEATWSVDLV